LSTILSLKDHQNQAGNKKNNPTIAILDVSMVGMEKNTQISSLPTLHGGRFSFFARAPASMQHKRGICRTARACESARIVMTPLFPEKLGRTTVVMVISSPF